MISQTRCFNFSTDNENNVMPSKLPDSGFVSPDSENWRKMSQELENHNISYDELRWKQSCLKNGTITINEVNTEFDSVTMKNGEGGGSGRYPYIAVVLPCNVTLEIHDA